MSETTSSTSECPTPPPELQADGLCDSCGRELGSWPRCYACFPPEGQNSQWGTEEEYEEEQPRVHDALVEPAPSPQESETEPATFLPRATMEIVSACPPEVAKFVIFGFALRCALASPFFDLSDPEVWKLGATTPVVKWVLLSAMKRSLSEVVPRHAMEQALSNLRTAAEELRQVRSTETRPTLGPLTSEPTIVTQPERSQLAQAVEWWRRNQEPPMTGLRFYTPPARADPGSRYECCNCGYHWDGWRACMLCQPLTMIATHQIPRNEEEQFLAGRVRPDADVVMPGENRFWPRRSTALQTRPAHLSRPRRPKHRYPLRFRRQADFRCDHCGRVWAEGRACMICEPVTHVSTTDIPRDADEEYDTAAFKLPPLLSDK